MVLITDQRRSQGRRKQENSVNSLGSRTLAEVLMDLHKRFRTSLRISNIVLRPDDLIRIQFCIPVGVFIHRNLIVTRACTVYGPVTEITSTQTSLLDPNITLGAGNASEYVKDRGVQFQYGDGKYGFMGYSQQDARF